MGWGMDGGSVPLTTRPQQYCDPASLVLFTTHNKPVWYHGFCYLVSIIKINLRIMSKLWDFTVHPILNQLLPQESESAVKNGLRWIFRSTTATFLRSKCYIRSNFQNWNFVNLIADLKSLQKTVWRKCLSFFKILIRT